jgi:hypothetical protein
MHKGRAAKPSIASHPLFPVVVVLWFGALFGLASLAIRPPLMEAFVAATGIDRVVPMAAPPLGSTARILIVLLMTILGCLVGALVARRVAKPAVQPSTRRRRPAPEAERAEEDASPVGMFGADQSATAEEEPSEQPLRRRRQLALMPQDDAFEDQAPLPGTQILSVAELPLKSFDEVDGIWLHDSDRAAPVKPASFAPEAADGATHDDPVLAGAPDDERLETFAQVAREIASDDAPDEANGRSNRLFETYVRRVNAGVGSNDGDLDPAPGFASVPASDHEDAPAMLDLDRTAEALPVTHDAPARSDQPAYANTAERIATAPLDALSHVELLERLAQTIARRRAQYAQASAQASAASSETVAAAEPVEPPVAPPRFAPPLAAAPELPAALRPHWAGDEDEQDDALPSTIPPRSITMKPVPAPIAPAAQDDDILAEGYSSLQGMTKPGPRQFVRIDEAENAAVPPPPVVAFPGLQDVAATAEPERRTFDAPQSAEPPPDQTEQALRAALATLRRMSGAA